MKTLLVTAAIIGLLANGTATAAEKIRVGVPQQVVHWMVFPLAQQKGFFKEEGFDAEIVRITGPSGRSALMSGDIDYYTTIAFIVQSAVVGLPVRLVAGYVNCPPFVLMSRPELKSAQELKGKTVGVGAPPGSSPDVIAKLSLRHLGLNPDRDVKFVYLNSHERTFLALEQATEELNVAWGKVTHLQSVADSPPLRAASNASFNPLNRKFGALSSVLL